jgi:hypothetical protein
VKDHRLNPTELNYVSRVHKFFLHACDSHWDLHVTGEVHKPATVMEHQNIADYVARSSE